MEVRSSKKKSSKGTVVSVAGVSLVVFIAVLSSRESTKQTTSRHANPQQSIRQPTSIDDLDTSVKKAKLRLGTLIKTHPASEVSVTMRSMIEEEEMLILDEPEWRIPGTVVALQRGTDRRTGHVIPVMNVGTEALMENSYSDRLIQLILFHEYQHIPDVVDTSRYTGPPRNNEDVTRYFNQELKAYLEECKLAVRLVWENEFSYCVRYKKEGESGLRKIWANDFAKIPAYAPFRGFILEELGK